MVEDSFDNIKKRFIYASDDRNTLDKNWKKIVYLPFAIIQWLYYLITYSIIGGTFITITGVFVLLKSAVMLEWEEFSDTIFIMTMPWVLPIKWWIDYIKLGEIGKYD